MEMTFHLCWLLLWTQYCLVCFCGVCYWCNILKSSFLPWVQTKFICGGCCHGYSLYSFVLVVAMDTAFVLVVAMDATYVCAGYIHCIAIHLCWSLPLMQTLCPVVQIVAMDSIQITISQCCLLPGIQTSFVCASCCYGYNLCFCGLLLWLQPLFVLAVAMVIIIQQPHYFVMCYSV